MSEIRAWRLFVKPWGEKESGVYGASRRSTVISRALSSANEVGYSFKWTDLRAVRAPEYDALIAKHGMVCWNADHAELMLRSAA